MRDTIWWLKIFLIAGIVGGAFGYWLAQAGRCANIIGGFKIGWC